MREKVTTARSLKITGVVQGVGFRPFVYRLARELGLAGVVGNDDGSVFVELEGEPQALDAFVARLGRDAPPLARIEAVEVATSPTMGRDSFAIVASRPAPGADVRLVPPDVATCDACLAELFDPADRRYLHPFISCTDCGPRFTVITALPYDRANTTMAPFALCRPCRAEYEDPSNRRYHAEPIGCHDCGPVLRFSLGAELGEHGPGALAKARAALGEGAILAVKGLGGYHLVCDATDDAALGELRRRKGRADKPLAVVLADLDAAREVAVIDEDSAALLVSPARPIVLVPERESSGLSRLVAPANPLVGVMLAYAPVHHLLLAGARSGAAQVHPAPGPGRTLRALVVTSSNFSGEPICYRDDDLLGRLGGLVDGVLAHDRDVHVPCDDSVVRVGRKGATVPIRRSRGYAPVALGLESVDAPLLAVGAQMKNVFCVAARQRAYMSQHIGDMANLETLEAFESSVARFCNFYRIDPALVAVDAHPGYLSSRWARRAFPDRIVEVQHHHAHLASLLAEHRRPPDETVIGFAFDGTGYGDDATIWGGELLEASAGTYRRVGHLSPVLLPGGDAAVRAPWRSALAHLAAAGIEWAGPSAHGRDRRELDVLERQLATGLGCVETTSMGRLFDAVSSLLGICQLATYEAQAAIGLEHAAASHRGPAVPLAFGRTDDGTWDAAPLLGALVAARRGGAATGALAAGFHVGLADLVLAAAKDRREHSGLRTVALSGGVFQNVLLAGLVEQRLESARFEVLSHRVVPCNDGGLALGQVLVASSRAARAPEV